MLIVVVLYIWNNNSYLESECGCDVQCFVQIDACVKIPRQRINSAVFSTEKYKLTPSLGEVTLNQIIDTLSMS